MSVVRGLTRGRSPISADRTQKSRQACGIESGWVMNVSPRRSAGVTDSRVASRCEAGITATRGSVSRGVVIRSGSSIGSYRNAMSAWPVRSPSTSSEKASVRISTRTRGCRVPNRSSTGARMPPGAGPSAAIRSTPSSPRANDRRVLRISSGPPTSSSSERIWALRADWARFRRAAAREKCSSSATATK